MSLSDYLQANYSPKSVKGYLSMIRRFRLSLGEQPSEQASYPSILSYLGELRKQGLHPKSLRNHLFALKIYFRYLVEVGIRSDHPCQYLQLKDRINRQIQLEDLYSYETLQDLYESHESKDPTHQRRDQIIISLLIYQALTVLEITELKKSDIDLSEKQISIRQSWSNNGRILGLKSSQVLLFDQYLQADWSSYYQAQKKDYFLMNPSGDQLWSGSINRLINRGKSKEERLLPLKIRQSVIAYLLREKKDVRVVQVFAGHRRTASTEAYQQSGLAALQSAINQFHPLQ